jgi:hypothetical protein
MTDIHELILNSDILVWHEGNTGQPGNWEGPYKLMAINGESCILALPRGNTTFRSTSVKPFNMPDVEVEVDPLEPERNSQETEGEEDIIVIDTSPIVPPKRGRGRPRKNANVTILLQDDIQYKDSR